MIRDSFIPKIHCHSTNRLVLLVTSHIIPGISLIINPDGSIFHLHVRPEQLSDKVILVGDPGRVALVASHFESKECEVESREFRTVTGLYQGKRITVLSTGIGCDMSEVIRIVVSNGMIVYALTRKTEGGK